MSLFSRCAQCISIAKYVCFEFRTIILAAGIWFFPDPQADGLASGIVWRDGSVAGDAYYLDGVDPIVTGDVELLESGEDDTTLDVSTGPGGEAVVDDCREKTAAVLP